MESRILQTGNIDGRSDDEDKSESQKYAESNVESGSDEDHSSQAEGSDHATSERMSTVSDTSSKSRKRALAEVDDEMRFRAQVVQRSSGEWHVEVKNAYYGHNHEVSPAVYRGYPTVRKIAEEAPIMRDVELMVASGSKRSRIYDYIRTHTPHEVQMQDVDNMFAKPKRSGKLGSSQSGAT
ncbi:unnamed protein product [Phytophthora fragariaefolia]|uniref:Unnamed protein product n=1 Tax=Phytophthora fragariaefolia TaxID=1490495 RepID=A0A9W6TM91_9STRA|nr:unnamed protein product [Phytophthora fragariaefolia]